jgi:hypothetical protein
VNKSILLIPVILFISFTDCLSQCNGYNYLCNRRYNEVAFLTAHNAFNSSADDFLLPNQSNGITQQLNEGVRAFMIDVYDVSGEPTVYHGSSYLGTKPLSYDLDQIKNFLDTNTGEIVSIIFESYITSDALGIALDNSGLSPYLFTKDSSLLWPTLQEMIDAGKRLVIFSEENNGQIGQDWYHYIWDHAVETEFSVHDTSEFNSGFNRGDSLNELFILNHFVTSGVTGTGSASNAITANSNPFLISRVNKVIAEKSKFPNFLALDFYELGNGLDVVNTLNSSNWYNIQNVSAEKPDIQIWPNPSKSFININIESINDFIGSIIKITNLLGQEIYQNQIRLPQTIIDLSDITGNGILFVFITDRNQNTLCVKKIFVTD